MERKDRICYLRKSLLHMTQFEFAGRINMSRSNLSNIEKGNINLTERVISNICQEFSVNPDWLNNGNEPVFVGGEGNNKPAGKIAGLYSQLSFENQNNAQGYMQRLLEEQKSSAAAFADNDSLTHEEIDQLKKILERFGKI